MAKGLQSLILLAVVLGVGVFIGSAVSQWTAPDPEAEAPEVQHHFGERVRVEVLNAGGVRHMARHATDRLRETGFDVVYFGNAESFGQERSEVLDRVGRIDAARAVADALGIESVRSEPAANLYLDVTVRLGIDWSPPGSETEAEEGSDGEELWWDPRNLLRSPERR